MSTFAVLFIALYVGHLVGDHWVQTSHQAQHKTEQPLERLKHVATLQITKMVFVAPLFFLGLDVHPVALVGGLLLDGLTHYWIDDRRNLRKLARMTGKEGFYDAGAPPVGTGAYQLDQSAHIAILYVVTLLLVIFG